MGNFIRIPEHVPVIISEEDIEQFTALLDVLGFAFTPVQILRKGAVYSKIRSDFFQGQEVELHIRVYNNGIITSEFEPKRLKHPLEHIFSKSYSAHEWIISKLEKFGIPYEVDEGMRYTYNSNAPTDFPKHYSELIKWLWGCIFHIPLALAWYAGHYSWKFLTQTYRSSVQKLISLFR